MKHFKQLLLILAFSGLGELLQNLIPLPVPASIYGLLLLFLALQTGLLKLEAVQTVGEWLISILPILFVAPGVSILCCWDLIKGDLLRLLAVILTATVVTFLVSGWVSQLLAERKDNHD